MLITVLEGDSLFMVSDTLTALRADTTENDSARILLAYHDVRIYKSDLQALADSLSYSSVDSIFRFYRAPVIWSDTSQFTADTIYLQMADDQIDQIFLRDNAFIINSPDKVYFNQIKGKNITATFEGDDLRTMDVNGNAESVYYARDEEGGYVGVNKTICSNMLLFFGDNQVDQIKFFAEPKAKLHPMQQVDHESLKIKGFDWQEAIRPLSVEDLFTELKRSLPGAGESGRGEKARVGEGESGRVGEENLEQGRVKEGEKPGG